MHVNEVILHGWLVKSPKEGKETLFGNLIKKQWKKRYFVLTYITEMKRSTSNKNLTRVSLTSTYNSTLNLSTSSPEQNTRMKTKTDKNRLELSYYESDKTQKLHGNIDLMRCEEILSHLPSKVFKHVFAIKTYNESGKLKTYSLAASSEEEMMMWVRQLTAYLKLVTESQNPKTPMSSSYKGLRRQNSTTNPSYMPQTPNFYSPSPNLSYSMLNSHYSGSINNLGSTLTHRNWVDNKDSFFPKTPFAMESNQQFYKQQSSKFKDNFYYPQDFRNFSALGTSLPEPPSGVPSNNTSTLPRSNTYREQTHLYDHPPIHMKYSAPSQYTDTFSQFGSIDRRKPRNYDPAVYDVPLHKVHPLSYPQNQVVNYNDPYDIPPKTPSNFLYDIPYPSKAFNDSS